MDGIDAVRAATFLAEFWGTPVAIIDDNGTLAVMRWSKAVMRGKRILEVVR